MSFLADFILNDSKGVIEKVNFSELTGKSILITGASGLVGQYMVASIRLAADKGAAPAKVFLVVTSALPEHFKDIIGTLPVTILTGDLTDTTFLSTLPTADYIIHAAGYGQPGKFMADPVKTLKLNTTATFETLGKLNIGGKYLFTSTSEVYSGLSNAPFKETQIGTTNTDHPRACYIEGKRGGEAIVNAYRTKGVHAVSARLSLAYGPGTRKDDARVINNFIKKALVDKRIDMLDPGASWRTYLYVTDAVEILFKLLLSGTEAIYNVGGTSRVTIKGLAGMVGKQTGVPVTFPADQKTALSGAPDDVFLDMSKVEKEFGKKDYIPLEEGLKRTIDWQGKLY